MSRFIQLHVLTSYPPSNLNRDDTGRPKSAVVGGVQRLRVSSQALKRCWRTSDEFRLVLGESAARTEDSRDRHIGTRTKTIGLDVYKKLQKAGIKDADAREWVKLIAQQFGALKKPKADTLDELEIEQLVHFSPAERAAVEELADLLASEKRAPTEEELRLLRRDHAAVDIALFGRMLAATPKFNTEAAAQVAHAFTVHRAQAEDDYFTAVDDLNKGDVDRGAGHVGELGFGAGVYYLYICINRDLLDENLSSDSALRNQALEALLKAMCKVAPTGKQNSFASRAHASFVLAEKGDQQPRSLALAYVEPVGEGNQIVDAVKRLTFQRTDLETMYGACSDEYRIASPVSLREALEKSDQGKAGSLDELIAFVKE